MSDPILTPATDQRLTRLEQKVLDPQTMTDADAAMLTDDLAFVQSVKRGITQARESVLGPLRQKLEQFRTAYDTVLKRIDVRENAMKCVLLSYRKAKEEAAQRAAEEAALAQGRLAAAEAQADAEMAGLPRAEAQAIAVQVQAAVTTQTAADIAPAPVPNVTAGLVGTTHVARRWTYEIVNEDLVPRDFLKLDEPAITRAIRAGVREIAGVRIFQTESIVGRGAR